MLRITTKFYEDQNVFVYSFIYLLEMYVSYVENAFMF